ncbi:MAG: hypothetical protein OIF50_03470 [Flavobacteriaceae bacterium]|nr:hypothetical protein [Flavobacteriaceae bacterium]
MKKISFLLCSILLLTACKKDADISLPSPDFSWTSSHVSKDNLEISIRLQSDADLPKGKIAIYVDKRAIQFYPPVKGVRTYTAYTFVDDEAHQLEVRFEFEDGRPSLSMEKSVQRAQETQTTSSVKADWTDL